MKDGRNKWNSQKIKINVVILILEMAIAFLILGAFIMKLNMDSYDSILEFLNDMWGRLVVAVFVVCAEVFWIIRDIKEIKRMLK